MVRSIPIPNYEYFERHSDPTRSPQLMFPNIFPLRMWQRKLILEPNSSMWPVLFRSHTVVPHKEKCKTEAMKRQNSIKESL